MKNGKNTKKIRNIVLQLICDIAFAVGAFWLAYLVNRVDVNWADITVARNMGVQMVVFVAVLVIFLLVLDCYNTVWKYAGRVDLYKFVLAYALAAVGLFLFWAAMLLISQLSGRERWVSLTIIVNFLAFSGILSGSMRFFRSIVRYVSHLKNTVDPLQSGKLLRTIVVGAGYTGMLAVNRFISNPDEGFMPVALIDDNEDKHGMKIYGIPVVGSLADIAKIAAQKNAQAIVIAISNITKSNLRTIYTKCRVLNLPIKIIPSIANADEEMCIATKEIRDIKIEELLGRDEFVVKKELIDKSVADKTVMVTGGAGSIGSELCRQALKFGCKHLIVFETHENSLFELGLEFSQKYDPAKYTLIVGNVRDKSKLKEVFDTNKPAVVFHAAAYKHVPMMEFSASEAVKNNVLRTINVIKQCKKSKIESLVVISTDKAVNPANIMGASKRIAEMCVQVYGRGCAVRMAAVRFGNVLGSNGSVVPIFLKQIKDGGPITLTHRDIKRYFMTIPESVRLVMQAGALAEHGEIFVLDMGEPVYIYDLACDLIRINGLIPEKDIKIEITGLRAGEKMFEELRYNEEAVDQTLHEGIFVNHMEDIDIKKFEDCLTRLQAATDAEDNKATEAVIFELVPSAYRNGNGGNE